MKLTMTSSGWMLLPEDVREEHDWLKTTEKENGKTGYIIPVLGRQRERLMALVPDVDAYRKRGEPWNSGGYFQSSTSLSTGHKLTSKR